jgi:hypothetical protein
MAAGDATAAELTQARYTVSRYKAVFGGDLPHGWFEQRHILPRLSSPLRTPPTNPSLRVPRCRPMTLTAANEKVAAQKAVLAAKKQEKEAAKASSLLHPRTRPPHPTPH